MTQDTMEHGFIQNYGKLIEKVYKLEEDVRRMDAVLLEISDSLLAEQREKEEAEQREKEERALEWKKWEKKLKEEVKKLKEV